MSHFLRNIVIAGLTVGCATFAVNGAFASEKLTIGMLACSEQGSEGHIFKATEKLSCIFQPNDKGIEPDKYVGKIEQLGIDIGKSGVGEMSWLVLSPSKDKAYKKGILAGTYGGVGVDAAAGVGGGVNLLVGKAFSLQPISVEAHDGVNVAVGVSKMTLSAE